MLCLKEATDPAWAELAAGRIDEILVDHAHCEMKAAANALSLAARAPGSPEVARALVLLAEEELRHFRAVLDLLEKRGIPLGTPPVDGYAAELRKRASASRKLRGARPKEGRAGAGLEGEPLVDRLLVGALIEARSCERFKLLETALSARGPEERELGRFYGELFAAEARHYVDLVGLATRAAGGDEAAVRQRLEELAVLEGKLVRELGVRATMHG